MKMKEFKDIFTKNKNIFYIVISIIFIIFVIININEFYKKKTILNHLSESDYTGTITFPMFMGSMFGSSNKGEAHYKYKDNIETYYYNDTYFEYMDYANHKKYSLRDGKYVKEDYNDTSNKERILNLLENARFKRKGKNTYIIKIKNKTVDTFVSLYKDMISFRNEDNYKQMIDNKNEYKITLTAEKGYMKKLKLYASKEKYLIFTFDNYNKVEDIKLPN